MTVKFLEDVLLPTKATEEVISIYQHVHGSDSKLPRVFHHNGKQDKRHELNTVASALVIKSNPKTLRTEQRASRTERSYSDATNGATNIAAATQTNGAGVSTSGAARAQHS